MKNFLLFITLFASAISFAQTDSVSQTKSAVSISDEVPSFPGGESEMMKFLQANLKYPQAEIEANISGKCYLGFVVETDGSITDIKILKGVPSGPGCDAEAIRVVKLMPKWIPGKQHGQIMKAQYTLPVKFTLKKKEVATENDTIYFNSDWNKCLKEEAKYYRIVEKQDVGYLVKDIFMGSNAPQMISNCSGLDPLIKNGKCTFYFDNGKKSSEGNYENNKQTGTWVSYFEDGKKSSVGNYQNEKQSGIWTIWQEDVKDSLVADCALGGTYKNIHVPANQTYNNEYNVSYKIEVMPEFPGGERAMMNFIQLSLNYPHYERDAGITGTSYVNFVVEEDGTIAEVKILRGLSGGSGCDKEALRVINSMPKWKPGSQYGKPVRVYFNLPIKFALR